MNPHLENTFLTGLEQNQQKLLRVCSVYAENEDDKKDLFQEAMINIWRAMPSFEGKSSLSTWMFRITLNVCLRLQSEELKKRNKFVKIDTLSLALVHEEPDPEEHERLVKLRNCCRSPANIQKER